MADESEGISYCWFNKREVLSIRNSRLYDERRWLQAYRNYRGLYGPEMVFRENEKSRVFVKITKTKVLAAFRSVDRSIIFSGKFPLGINPTSGTRRNT